MIKNNFITRVGELVLDKKLSEAEVLLVDSIMAAAADHGPDTASAMNVRNSISTGNSISHGVAAGLLGLGPKHGLAISPAMQFFYTYIQHPDIPSLLVEMKEQGRYVPGYGHKVYTNVDPRSQALFTRATELGLSGIYSEFAMKVHAALQECSSKELPLNIDGAIAAVLCDLDVDASRGNGLFISARTIGLLYQGYDEATSGKGVRRGH